MRHLKLTKHLDFDQNNKHSELFYMNNLIYFLIIMTCGLVFSNTLRAQDEAHSKDEQARDAVAKKDTDVDSEKALEEVFEAASQNYSLLNSGAVALNYGADYTYYGDQSVRLSIEPKLDTNGQQVNNATVIRSASVERSATHTLINSFTFDYGLFNNLTLSARLPLIAKYDSENDLNNYSVGDVSGTIRLQPFRYVPGDVTHTYSLTYTAKTGDSPYEIDLNKTLSSGSGTHSLTAGVSLSQVLDPVVLFGSSSVRYNLPIKELNQVRQGYLLRKVDPGIDFSFSMGFSYALSYDVSLSTSFQGSFNTSTTLGLESSATQELREIKTGSQMSGIMNFALGIRMSPKNIINVNVGYGVTEQAPDILIGVSMPILIAGVKPSASN